MRTKHVFHITIIFLCLGFVMTGCITDPMSWSPDGRYLVFVGMDDQKLWLWDGQQQTASLLVDEDVIGCRFLSSADELIYLKPLEGQSETCEFYKINIHNKNRQKIVENARFYFDISDDNRSLYFMRDNKEKNATELWRKDLVDNKETMLLSKDNSEIFCVDVDAGGKRFLLTVDETYLALWREGDKELRMLHDGGEHELAFAKWVDDDRYLYFVSDNDNETADLYIDSLSKSNPRMLCENAFLWDAPSIDLTRKSIVITKVVGHEETRLISVDLSSGEQTVMIDNPLGASWAAVDAQWNRIAYISDTFDNNSEAIMYISDIEKHRTRIVWRDEEEKAYAVAEALFRSGETALAISAYQNFLVEYPKSRLVDVARIYLMKIYTSPDHLDIDKAYKILTEMKEDNAYAHKIFWDKTASIATDDSGDWIMKYGNDEARQKFEFDTDLSRDLLGLSVRSSKERLYLKIDYASNRDLSGLAFQDTFILLDYESPDRGYRMISGKTEWDRGAERMIRYRHWYISGFKSQFDISIVNEKGEDISRFIATGFYNPIMTNFNVIEIHDESQGSIVLSIPREVLDAVGDRKMSIQVCTAKGGIESFQGLEKPQRTLDDGKPFCEVTDAFGDENNAQRIFDEVSGGKTPVIKGVAAVVELD